MGIYVHELLGSSGLDSEVNNLQLIIQSEQVKTKIFKPN